MYVRALACMSVCEEANELPSDPANLVVDNKACFSVCCRSKSKLFNVV